MTDKLTVEQVEKFIDSVEAPQYAWSKLAQFLGQYGLHIATFVGDIGYVKPTKGGNAVAKFNGMSRKDMKRLVRDVAAGKVAAKKRRRRGSQQREEKQE